MAHPPETKGRALALLLAGNTPRYVAEQTGVPLTTCKRWAAEARGMLREALAITPADLAPLQEQIRSVRAFFPGLFSDGIANNATKQNGPKKQT